MPMTMQCFLGSGSAGVMLGRYRLWAVLLAFCYLQVPRAAAQSSYSPHVSEDYPTRLLWGDTHLHTSLSLDARAFGTRLDPDQAFRFARGETLTATRGEVVRLSRPLDFLAIADHSDGLGAMNAIIAGDPTLLADPVVKQWHEMLSQGGKQQLRAAMDVIVSFTRGDIPPVLQDRDFSGKVWREYLATTDRHNSPGQFTTLPAYEWTSTENGNNLHRNVLYRDGADKAGRLLPYTTLESFNPEDLWRWMARYERETGGQVLALAHNGNLSNGLMFPVEQNPATGEPLGGDYLEQRARWEPLYEITQIKGDGESHPALSPGDAFAGHDVLWDRFNLLLEPKTPQMLPYEYAREALKNGLKLAREKGVNPYRFGVVGSTDSHTGLATAEEDNFFGKHTGMEPAADRWRSPIGESDGTSVLGWTMVSSGYAAVWARENTREAIFDAMMRKEVYATTGSRIALRFFGGWEYEAADAQAYRFAESGYRKGVAMGSDLPLRGDESGTPAVGPAFMVLAMKDPIGANLDRLQMVKGWVDTQGKTHEQVYDIARSERDSPGAPELRTVWRDPDFKPAHAAFYYVRVLEVPSPRWTSYDARYYGSKMDPEVPATVRERAYSSAIWYRPQAAAN